MKKFLALLVATIMLISCCACGKESDQTSQTESQPQTEYVSVLKSVKVIRSNFPTNEYVVGNNLTIDEYGRILEIDKANSVVKFNYDIGDPAYNTAKTFNRNGEETVFYSWRWHDGYPINYHATFKDSYTYNRSATFTHRIDEKDRINILVQDMRFTDTNGQVKVNSLEKYEMTYDDNDRITSWNYYINNKLDHKTTFEYDKNGNITVYSCSGGTLGEYIRVEFTYTTVESSKISPLSYTSFQTCMTLEFMIESIVKS